MSTEENKRIYLGLCEAFDRGEVHRFRDFLAPDYVEHDPNRPDHDREETCQDWESLLAAFGELKTTPLQLVSEGDMLACRFIIEGTPAGQAAIAPIGRRIRVESFEIVRIADGRLEESWGISDRLGLMQKAIEANKALAKRYIDEVLRGDTVAAEEVHPANFRRAGPGYVDTSRDAFLARFATLRAACPDWTFTAEEVVAEGNTVVCYGRDRGTHQASFQGLAATGRAFEFEAVEILHIRDGQVQDATSLYDPGTLFRQLGVEYGPIPPKAG
jgi:predicted ester cyclase